MIVLKVYSIGRFLITTFLLCALAWFGFTTLGKFQTRAFDTLTPVDELIRTIKNSQINLEKYRQFEQIVQLEDVAKNVAWAENKLNIFARGVLPETTQVEKPTIFATIDSLTKSIKSQKEIITNLKEIHQEEDLSKTSISGIGNLRIELEKVVNMAIALRKLTLAEIGVQSRKILHRLKFALPIALGLALVLYVIELILLFRALRYKKPAQDLPEITNSPPPEPVPAAVQPRQYPDIPLLQSNFRKIEETVDDMGERISLMAFNALLEAARAGEAGKGFQIVAEELRRLADRSLKSASEVKKLLEEISNKLSNVNPTQS